MQSWEGARWEQMRRRWENMIKLSSNKILFHSQTFIGRWRITFINIKNHTHILSLSVSLSYRKMKVFTSGEGIWKPKYLIKTPFKVFIVMFKMDCLLLGFRHKILTMPSDFSGFWGIICERICILEVYCDKD